MKDNPTLEDLIHDINLLADWGIFITPEGIGTLKSEQGRRLGTILLVAQQTNHMLSVHNLSVNNQLKTLLTTARQFGSVFSHLVDCFGSQEDNDNE